MGKLETEILIKAENGNLKKIEILLLQSLHYSIVQTGYVNGLGKEWFTLIF